MNKFIKKYYKYIIPLTIILVFSLLNIYKGYLLKNIYKSYFKKELIILLISIFIFYIIYKIDFKYIYKYRYLLYILNIFLLIYVLIFSPKINGTKAWIDFKIFNFQPSELLKITLPIVIVPLIKEKKYIKSIILFIIPSILILLEPDTGNFVLISILFFYLLYNKKSKKILNLIILILSIIAVSTIIFFKFNPSLLTNIFNGKLYYRFERIFNINNNIQTKNALIAIGSSNLFNFNLKNINIYIPEGITDFIFAFNIENYGYISGLIIITMYFILIINLSNKYIKIKNNYKKKIIGSFIVLFTSQFLYNLFMNIGLLPIMGIPMPFLSYGGSSIITYTIMLSILTKKISSNEDKGNNNYKKNFQKDNKD